MNQLIPEICSTVACYRSRSPLHSHEIVLPVIAWDAEAYALVVEADRGRLVRAVDYEPNAGMEFDALRN